jgi:hypothetical protein
VKTSSVSSNSNRAWWLKQLHQWHWISSAICLIAMLLFAVTGITLNHAADIPAKPVVTTLHAQAPANLLQGVEAEGNAPHNAPLPKALRGWLAKALKVDVPDAAAEWSPEEIYLPLPQPGGDAWLRIARDTGEVEYEHTSRGWVSYLNDLHKGRNTGFAWKLFLDVFSVACLLFCVTGLLILKFHAANRPSTWPLVGLGLVLPLLLLILFIH